MKAIAVYPGKPHSIHLEEVAKPKLTDIPGGQGVLVKVLRVGVDGMDKEIYKGKYGSAPEGSEFLIIGHENIGQVVAVGPNVPATITPGKYVVASVRRPGQSLYDRIGLQDMTTDPVYHERGITLLHGFMTEYYVEDADFLIPLPDKLRDIGVLLEPFSVVEKGINQAFEIQRRLKVWKPRRAAVIGAGAIGLCATLALRLRGIEVICLSRRTAPYRNSLLIEEIGGKYLSLHDVSIAEQGTFDMIIEATGASPLVFEAAEALASNGVLILGSLTAGQARAEVNTDKINLSFVLGNKLMFGTVNASREDFIRGVRDMTLAETQFPGWLSQLLTTPIAGLDQYAEMVEHMLEDKDAIKVYVETASA